MWIEIESVDGDREDWESERVDRDREGKENYNCWIKIESVDRD